MSDSASQTPPVDDDQSGNLPPTDQSQQDDTGAIDDSNDEMVTIPKSQLEKLQSSNKKLVSNSTKSFNELKQTQAQVAELAFKQDAQDFLSANADKFKNVTIDDLRSAESPDDFESLATQTQQRIDEAVQKRLGDLQVVETPVMSPEEKASKLKKLKSSPGMASFESYIATQSN